jgi:hypothetical protein
MSKAGKMLTINASRHSKQDSECKFALIFCPIHAPPASLTLQHEGIQAVIEPQNVLLLPHLSMRLKKSITFLYAFLPSM